MSTYNVVTYGNTKAIKCSVCQKESFNERDIREKYCGYCHKFHDDPPEQAISGARMPQDARKMGNMAFAQAHQGNARIL